METKGLINLVQAVHLNMGQLMSQEVNDSPKITLFKKNFPLKVFFFFKSVCLLSIVLVPRESLSPLVPFPEVTIIWACFFPHFILF